MEKYFILFIFLFNIGFIFYSIYLWKEETKPIESSTRKVIANLWSIMLIGSIVTPIIASIIFDYLFLTTLLITITVFCLLEYKTQKFFYMK